MSFTYLPSFYVIVFSSFSISLFSVQTPLHLCYVAMWLVFIFSYFHPPPPLSSICPFILVVSLDLLLLRPTCQDHRELLWTTWQRLSSRSIKLSSERPLSSCLFYTLGEGVHVLLFCSCGYFFCLFFFFTFKKMPPNEKQSSSWFEGWQKRKRDRSLEGIIWYPQGHSRDVQEINSTKMDGDCRGGK